MKAAASIPANMIGRHIANNPDIFEPARSNCFDLVITGIDKLLKEGIVAETATDEDYIYNPSDVIRLSMDSFSAAALHYSIQPIEVRRVNSTIKFAGQVSWEAGSFKCTDFVGAHTKAVLMALRAQAYDINGDVIHEAANYKHTWNVLEYNVDYTKVIRTWTLYGAWISKVTEDNDFSHDDSGKRTLSVTVEYDRAIPSDAAEAEE